MKTNNLRINDIMSKKNSDLYKIALDIMKKLKEDIETIDDWHDINRDRWFFQVKEKLPRLNFESSVSDRIDYLLGVYSMPARDEYNRLKNIIGKINKLCLISTKKVDELDREYFLDLFNVSYTSESVIKYILENYID